MHGIPEIRMFERFEKKKGKGEKKSWDRRRKRINGDSNEIWACNEERWQTTGCFEIIKMLKHVGKFHYLPPFPPPLPDINSEAYIKIALAAEMALRSSHNSYSTRATRTCKMARSSRLRAPSPLHAVVRENFFSLLSSTLINSLIRESPPRTKRSSSHRGWRIPRFMHLFLSRFLSVSSP